LVGLHAGFQKADATVFYALMVEDTRKYGAIRLAAAGMDRIAAVMDYGRFDSA
jgi:hypothetical protein